ncbi:MAG: HAMP domain-containing histidine kinase, partial [Spirochaetaceae bacterium]|nr:HAMP domain-containing histidine kinase [Spirochaetaceae bacterium]
LKMKHNDELTAALKRAKESDEAKSLFLLSMSHDLRTPMNSIIGYSDLALSNIGDGEIINSSLLEIKAASNLLLNILEELLYMSTIEQDEIYLKREEFNIKETFEKIIQNSIEKINQKKIKLWESISLKHANVIGDEERLITVINNIVNNSIDYTEKGSINISVDEKTVNESKSIYKIIIKDTGIGMTKEQQERIFGKFYTAKGSKSYKTGGLGIGLNISKGILDKMNASISLDSTYEKGTTFTIEIPFDLKPIGNERTPSDLKKI